MHNKLGTILHEHFDGEKLTTEFGGGSLTEEMTSGEW